MVSSAWLDRRSVWVQSAIALMLALAAPRVGAQGVDVALLPDSQLVSPGAEFDLEIDVTEPGSPFNGYDAVLSYDPAALTFLPTSPLTLQEGSYMTGACGNTFQRFNYGGDSLIISHALLCNELSLTGPGQLYRLHFRASSTSQTTSVRFRQVQFYNGGLYVNPVRAVDATVIIRPPSGVVDRGGRMLADFWLGPPLPNPTPAASQIEFEVMRAAAVRIGVCDVQGRELVTLVAATHPPGRYRARWDGQARGVPVPTGVYFVHMRVPAGDMVRRLIVAR